MKHTGRSGERSKSLGKRLLKAVRRLVGSGARSSSVVPRLGSQGNAIPPNPALSTSGSASALDQRRLLLASGLLKSDWYWRQQPPGTPVHGIDPVDHYLQSLPEAATYPCPFFNAQWYRSQSDEVDGENADPLVHYLTIGWRAGRRPHPLFNGKAYSKRYPDIHGDQNPLVHFLTYGASEGRVAFDPKVFDEPDATAMLESHLERAAAGRPIGKIRRSAGIAIYTNSGGNYFFDQIADILAAGLMELDVRVSRNDEHGYDPIADMHLVVAPHEFFEVGSKPGSELLKSGAKLSMYCTEQWQTPWFARSIPHALRAATVLDISLTSATAFRSIGVEAYFLPPGPSTLYEPVQADHQIPDLPGLEGLEDRAAGQSPSHLSHAHERSLDFVFIGSHSERRERILAQAAAALSRHKGFIHLPFPRRPYRVGSTATLSSADVAAICRRAKILINIHQQPMNYFEWHRIVNIGIQNGCAVLTEETEAIPGLSPGEHYVEFSPERLGLRLQWLLESPEGRLSLEEIPARARAAVQSRYNMASAWQRIIELA